MVFNAASCNFNIEFNVYSFWWSLILLFSSLFLFLVLFSFVLFSFVLFMCEIHITRLSNLYVPLYITSILNFYTALINIKNGRSLSVFVKLFLYCLRERMGEGGREIAEYLFYDNHFLKQYFNCGKIHVFLGYRRLKFLPRTFY